MDPKNKSKEELILMLQELQQQYSALQSELRNARDETDRVEAKYREDLELYHSILNASPDDITVTDMEGRILMASPSALRMFGYNSVEDARGRRHLDFLVADDREEAVMNIRLKLEGHLTGPSEYRALRRDGSTFNLEIHSEFIRDGEGKPVKLLLIGRDITRRKLLEAELLKAKQSAEEKDHLKSAFLANMSHEIRTPMNGILGFSDLLTNPSLTKDQLQEYVEIIQQSGKRMLGVINDIIDLSRIEAGLMHVENAESNINEQLDHLYKFFKPEAGAKGIELRLNKLLSAPDATIITDREKLFAILTNLIKNAIKFTQAGSIEFGYVLKSDNDPAVLEFYVKDTGIGIRKGEIETIFERFSQIDIENGLTHQGAGLGLAITKSYVELLGGQIRVVSEEGVGSTFYFTIPYVIENQDSSSQVEVVNNMAGGLTILIAEDDETSALLISTMVKSVASQILTVLNGDQAIEALQKNPDIDLILMDIKMPIMGGYEATRKIRQFNNDVVIIAQTAFGLSGDREKSIAAGCNDFISKPIIKKNLLALIHAHCSLQ